jgi:galactokinase
MTHGAERTNLQNSFQQIFGPHADSPRVFRAPGRTNLIGEHTDYNDGFVLPAAIDRATWVAITPRDDGIVRIHSDHFGETVEFDARESSPQPRRHWSDYIRGVELMLQRAGVRVSGADMLIRGDLPLGGGVSSSASLEVASAMAFTAIASAEIPLIDLAKICQRAENEFVGARCGIMDQFAACFARAGHAVFLDCRTLQHAAVPLPANVSLVLCNTMVKHENAAGEYNARRRECEEAVARLAAAIPGVCALRDIGPSQLEQYRALLPGKLFQRAMHVASEDQRVLDARVALENGDLQRLGALMAASHASLRDDYEVSCAELDLMVRFANEFDGRFGARMTGGGFGGCTISIVESARAADFSSYIGTRYQRETGIAPEIYVCAAAGAAEELP